MIDVEPEPKFSVIDDWQEIANKWMSNVEEEILDFKVVHWDITNWNQLDQRTLGPVFQAGGHNWNILMFPKGNNQGDYTSVYLDLTDAKGNSEEYACAQFVVLLSKPSDPTKYVTHHAQHRFVKEESDWGFTRFITMRDLYGSEDNAEGLLEDNAIRLTTIIRVVNDSNGILWHNFIKQKVTGCVGLQNQGATCYMNSLFQSLYFTNSFRKAVYQIPTENDEPTKSVALALQRVFYNLQFNNGAVGTTELTKSFGWDSLEAFKQHDVQEFNRVLQDNLEIKMKDTPADGAIKDLFVGKMKSYIKCINVNFESSRSEDYYDIQLNVKGCNNLEDSFKDYITEETLEGDNKYMAEGYGLQDAKKGVIFESFPPVLHLQLKRFEYDMMRDMMVKINDRHEFPLEIDMEPYLSDSADKSKSHVYKLHGVLVHSGDLSGGHYFAFVKPTKNGKWLKFDDDRVIPATFKEVLEENFGGEQTGVPGLPLHHNGRPLNRFTNAYMLVYIRECMQDDVLAAVTEQDIPKHLAERIQQEARIRAQKQKERDEQFLYMKTFIATDKTFAANHGFDFADFDEKNAENNHLTILRTRKDQPFGEYKAELAQAMSIRPDEFRLWIMVNRQNRTVRIDMPILNEESASTIEEIRQRYSATQTNLRLYLERAMYDADGNPVFPLAPQESSGLSLVFIKLFTPSTQTIQGVGHIYVTKNAKVESAIKPIKELLECPEEQDIVLFEEIKPGMIDKMDTSLTFIQAEIQDGDIICVQPALTDDETFDILQKDGKTSVDTFMEYEMGKIRVLFAPYNDSTAPVELVLHKDNSYDYVVRAIANTLETDPEKLRLYSPHVHGSKIPIKHSPDMKLQKIIQPVFNSVNTANHRYHLFYEKLDISLQEMESKCKVRVIICTPTLKEEMPVEVLLSKGSGLQEMLEALVEKGANFTSKTGTRKVRVFDTQDNKFNIEYNDETLRILISKSSAIQLYAEEIPQEEVDMTSDDHFINVFHFQRVISHTHSVPFKFVLKKGESLEDTKKRLQARTGLDDKEWSKVKLYLVSDDQKLAINDDDESLSTDFEPTKQDSLGLEHIDKSIKSDRNGSGAIFIRG
ncbi:cysteine proteinase [Backusella circina FSU 941]|nr:cysteine proteinase [Backusella circina FSU 941]